MLTHKIICAVLIGLRISVSSLSLVKNAGIRLQYLEGNSWLWEIGDLSILVDPLFDVLDFGAPLFYTGSKKYVNSDLKLAEIVPTIDYVLISQGLDDHANSKTLRKLFAARPDLQYIAPPSAVSVLKSCGVQPSKISLISPGNKFQIAKGKVDLEIVATKGAVVGPPWQSAENGYIIRQSDLLSNIFPPLYYEPHCMFEESELSRYNVDIVITPVTGQEILGYALVEGGEKAFRLAQLLNAKYIVPMTNGDLEQNGILASLVKSKGTMESFENIVKVSKSKLKVVQARPGAIVSFP